MEEWREIDDFPGYFVSDEGRVRGRRKSILKEVDGGQGYLKVTLSKNGEHTDKRINRLVAEAFLDNPNELPVVMHLDNNRKNNNVNNLRWGTVSENNQWMHDCGRHPLTLTDEDREKAYRKRRAPIKAINTLTNDVHVFCSQHEASRNLGVSQQHIWGVLNNHRKTTGGYKFEYLDKDEFDAEYYK